MKRLKILIWHIHGSYLNTLSRVEHDWFLPVKPDGSEGYLGRGTTFDIPDYVRVVEASDVRNLDLDLVIYQTPTNWNVDRMEILSEEQRSLPSVYLEHNTPKPDAVNMRHPMAETGVPVVHVTHYNRLMWDNGGAPTRVIEHSVAIDEHARYEGTLERGVTVINGMQKRPRIAGLDIFQAARQHVPLDLAGMETEALGGLGDIPYRDLHGVMAKYRFLFSPIRYTSLPLAVIEAMTIGMPVVALATTELPMVLRNGETGYISCDVDELIEGMQHLIANPAEAARMGRNAREIAVSRFGLQRFIDDWNALFEELTSGGSRVALGQRQEVHS